MSLSFARDIRPLFTDQDIEHMEFVFNLSDFDDVVANATLIYERLADKSMPPNQPWPDAEIARFKQWLDEGLQP